MLKYIIILDITIVDYVRYYEPTKYTFLRVVTPSWIGCGKPAKLSLSPCNLYPTNFILATSRKVSTSFCLTLGVHGKPDEGDIKY